MLNARNLNLLFKFNEKWFILSSKRCVISSTWDKFLSKEEQKKIEEKWKPIVSRTRYEKKTEFSKKNSKKKYVLSMFPYPSGNLHMGHVRVYTISDAIARFYSMKGYKVIHPMGWDAFGLPAENAAIERGLNPHTWTMNNIKRMKDQLKGLSCAFDWWREIATCDPKYYKWTQFIFLKLYERGLVYRQESVVNWDPVDKTVLANEQVDENGCSWRSGAKVVKKPLTQWFIKATSLSKELYDDLSHPSLIDWKDVPAMQKHWIGECNGYSIEMKVEDDSGKLVSAVHHLPVWMARPEYISNIAFLALKSDNVLNKIIYKQSTKGNSTILNIKAVEPLSRRRIPIIINDALNYNKGLDIYVGIPLLREKDKMLCEDLEFDTGVTTLNKSDSSKEDIVSQLRDLNCGGYKCSARLKDWLISRQRYWGTPIPIVHCASCGTVPVSEDMLPVELPTVSGFTVKGMSALREDKSWFHCACPRCGQEAERETDTMDTFVDSSWYFLRFLDPENEKELIGRETGDELMPVDLYIGGKEHATLHLYFARFMQKFLKHIGIVGHSEPFTQLLMQGMVKGKSYQVQETGRYLAPDQVDFSVSPPVEAGTKRPLLIQHEKMSKSKLNGVDPQIILDDYGVDAVRLAILSQVGPQAERNWNSEDLNHSFQIMSKLWSMTRHFIFTRKGIETENMNPCSEEETQENENFLFETRNQLVLRASDSFENGMQYHSAIRCVQQLIGACLRVPKNLIYSDEYDKSLRCALLLLYPMTPHLSAELWERINEVSNLKEYKTSSSIVEESWPSIDPNYEMEIVYKINEEEVSTLRLCQSKFDILTKEKAMQMAQEDSVLAPIITRSTIYHSDFKYTPNYKAMLSIRTKNIKEIKKSKKEKVQKSQ